MNSYPKTKMSSDFQIEIWIAFRNMFNQLYPANPFSLNLWFILKLSAKFNDLSIDHTHSPITTKSYFYNFLIWILSFCLFPLFPKFLATKFEYSLFFNRLLNVRSGMLKILDTAYLRLFCHFELSLQQSSICP